MTGAIAAIIAALVGLVAFFRRKANRAEGARKDAEERTNSAEQALQRANGYRTAGDIIREHAAKAEADIIAKQAHDAALADAEIKKVDTAASQGAKALSDLANERIRAARGVKR